MYYQQHGLMHSPNSMPALLTIYHNVFANYDIGIAEDARGRLKINASMLLLVGSVLFDIPFKEQAVIHIV
jgi:hypothetical protein